MFNLHDASAFYSVSPDDFAQAFGICCRSPYITSNPAYEESVKKLKLMVDTESDERDLVNAFAGFDGTNYVVCVQEGMLRWLSMVAIVCTRLHAGEKPSKCRKMLEWGANRLTRGKAGSDFLERFIMDFQLKLSTYDIELQKTYGIALTTAILAHEIGHICLNHGGYDEKVNSSNRNMERQADLFSYSVIQSNGASELSAVATIIAYASLNYLDAGKKRKKNKTDGMYSHPAASERVLNAIESFSAQLAHSKITPKMLKEVGGVK